jgi:hypothetical protein
MKLNRAQIVLAALLLAQVALSAFSLWPRSGAAAANEPLFPGLDDADVVALTVTDNQSQTISLRKVTGNWVLPSADDYPANNETINPLLDKIKAITTLRLVTRTEASHKRLQVGSDSFLRRVKLETAGGQAYTLYIGSAPSYGASHVRPEGRNEVYLADGISQWDFGTAPVPWVSGTYLSVSQDEVQQVVLANAAGSFTFSKGEDATWVWEGLPVGEQLASSEVSNVVSRATYVTMTLPLGKQKLPEYGMDRPLAVVTLKKASETITVSVGAKDPTDNSYVVNVSTSPYYVRVSEYSAQALVEDTSSSFILLPATPTPGS